MAINRKLIFSTAAECRREGWPKAEALAQAWADAKSGALERSAYFRRRVAEIREARAKAEAAAEAVRPHREFMQKLRALPVLGRVTERTEGAVAGEAAAHFPFARKEVA